jgi:amidase
MPTAAGAVVFENAYAKKDAGVIDRLLQQGLIILAKASMTEFCGLKATCMTAGWCGVNGQTQSAYIPGGVRKDDVFYGRSTPGESSSGSAVGVSAGFAPLSLGTETSGSICMPANRAGLYSVKVTHGSVPLDGVSALSEEFDGLGAMAKSVGDLELLIHALNGSKAVEPLDWS